MSLSREDIWLFNQGTWYRSYEHMGAHPRPSGGVDFSVWAPGALKVCVTGSFNDWNPDEYSMVPVFESGIWECFVPAARAFDCYKFVITSDTGDVFYKADPYAFFAQKRPETASVVTESGAYSWQDGEWMSKRSSRDHFRLPMNIYELDAGSWRTKLTVMSRKAEVTSGDSGGPSLPPPDETQKASSGDSDVFLSWRETADLLVPYVCDMGYTHIELMPVAEHPFDGSWGYQITGYFAPTSRYGSPDDLRYLIDKCHGAGISVIMDWVPGHFCKDSHGLGLFNGHKLYEKREHKEWGTYIFDLGRPEVKGFLLSNAFYWLDSFHFDGIRMDGVSSMLYLNYGVNDPEEKIFNEYGGEENLDAVAFIRSFNEMAGKYFPGVITIAEESTAWPLVTYPPSDGGLGFHYKWNMGWMNDTLSYFSSDFPQRKDMHGKLTFSMMYAFSENFILPLSHDEVVHGKRSLIGRMPGDYGQQFKGLRCLAMYQMCHPGGKLNFMGNEFAQFVEWRYYESLEWFLLDYETHREHLDFIRRLNLYYLAAPSLWRDSYGWEGFGWIDADNGAQSVLSFVRRDTLCGGHVVCVFNFSRNDYPVFRLGVPEYGVYEIAFQTLPKNAGETARGRSVRAEENPLHGQEQSIIIELPSLCGLILEFKKALPAPRKKRQARRSAPRGRK